MIEKFDFELLTILEIKCKLVRVDYVQQIIITKWNFGEIEYFPGVVDIMLRLVGEHSPEIPKYFEFDRIKKWL